MATLQQQMLSVVAISLVVMIQGAIAYDPTITSDFGLTNAQSGENFTNRAFEPMNLAPAPAAGGLVLTPSFAAQFPGVTGLGISSLFFEVGAGGLVPPHFHARATEIFYVISGTWSVGFVDTTGMLYSAHLTAGDQFVFPQGLVHYQLAGHASATGFSAFNSQNPGVTLIASTLFASTPSIPDAVLKASFKVDSKTVQAIRKALSS